MMKFTVENNNMVGHESIDYFLKEFCKVLNECFVSDGNKITLKVPDPELNDGLYNVKITVEFETRPHARFGAET